MKFELFEDESYLMWGVRKVGETDGVLFHDRRRALHALTLIESWVNEAAANANTRKELPETEHTANAIKALENYNLAKNDQAADYEKGIRE
jgi:hypothetical protein